MEVRQTRCGAQISKQGTQGVGKYVTEYSSVPVERIVVFVFLGPNAVLRPEPTGLVRWIFIVFPPEFEFFRKSNVRESTTVPSLASYWRSIFLNFSSVFNNSYA